MSHRGLLEKLVLPAVVAAAIGIAGCGGDEEPAEGAKPPAAASGAEPPKLKLKPLEDTGGAQSGSPSTTADPAQALEQVRERFREAAAREMKANGLSDSQVECVLPKLEGSIDDGQLERAMESGDADELRELGTEAAEACGATLR